MSDSAQPPVEVARLTDIPEGKTLCVEHDGREVLLCHTRDGLYAVDNLCSHAEARLCEGRLRGGKILCPLHGAAFDVKTGEALTRPAVLPLATWRVIVEEDRVLLTTET